MVNICFNNCRDILNISVKTVYTAIVVIERRRQ